MADKFKMADYVRVKQSRQIRTGAIQSPKNFKGQYLVKFDPTTNDTELNDEALHYEDELELSAPPTTI